MSVTKLTSTVKQKKDHRFSFLLTERGQRLESLMTLNVSLRRKFITTICFHIILLELHKRWELWASLCPVCLLYITSNLLVCSLRCLYKPKLSQRFLQTSLTSRFVLESFRPFYFFNLFMLYLIMWHKQEGKGGILFAFTTLSLQCELQHSPTLVFPVQSGLSQLSAQLANEHYRQKLFEQQ